MFERIFKYHYSNKFAYALDAFMYLASIRSDSFPQWFHFDYSIQLDKPVLLHLALAVLHFLEAIKCFCVLQPLSILVKLPGLLLIVTYMHFILKPILEGITTIAITILL